MSIIDKLGGYSRAKNYLENELIHGYKKIQLKSELLEYRREHGIFEVGDKVVSDDSGMIMIFGDGCEKWFCLRHATPEEIKAGHRLP